MKRSKSNNNLVKFHEEESDSDPAPDSPLNPGDDEDVDMDEDDSTMIQREKKPKVELTESGSDSHGSTLNGNSKETIADKSVEVDNCQHPGLNLGECIRCGQKLDSQSGVSIDYKQKGLMPAPDEASRLREEYLESLLERKKLYLVLDLDHTLLNSADLGDLLNSDDHGDLTEEELYLKNQTADTMPGGYKDSLYTVSSLGMFTKLRPFVHTFLKEASGQFEMSIYTLAKREYAEEMVKLLDPKDVYFKSRVIAEEDSSQKDQKGLDVVPAHESAVLILDDTESVWKNHLENLILMDKYHFFASSRKQFDLNGKSHAESRGDESEKKGNLAFILKVLKQVHALFFDQELSEDHLDPDVRQILKAVKKKVLKGCKIVFTHFFPPDVNPEDDPVWKTAGEFGASCLKEVDPTVTHVIFGNFGTIESQCAVMENQFLFSPGLLCENQFLVSPGWLGDSICAWQRQPEEKYAVISKEGKKDQFM